MTYYKVDAATCESIFTKAEDSKTTASTYHTSISTDIDTLSSACTGKSATLSSSLNGIYNRVLTAGMTAAEQQVENAVAGGRSAVAAIQAGDYEMAERTAQEANAVDEVSITDGKEA